MDGDKLCAESTGWSAANSVLFVCVSAGDRFTQQPAHVVLNRGEGSAFRSTRTPFNIPPPPSSIAAQISRIEWRRGKGGTDRRTMSDGKQIQGEEERRAGDHSSRSRKRRGRPQSLIASDRTVSSHFPAMPPPSFPLFFLFLILVWDRNLKILEGREGLVRKADPSFLPNLFCASSDKKEEVSKRRFRQKRGAR